MSVTSPTLIAGPAEPYPPVVAAVVSVAVVALLDVSSSPPHRGYRRSSRGTSSASRRASLMSEVIPEGAGSKPRPFRWNRVA